MKKILYLFAAAAFVFASCEEKPVDQRTEEEKQIDAELEDSKYENALEFIDGTIDVLGTGWSADGSYCYDITLYTDIQYDEEYNVVGAGDIVLLDLFGLTKLPNGVYNFSTDSVAGVFNQTYSAWYHYDETGKETALTLAAGKVVVKCENRVYDIRIDVTDEKGVQHLAKFTGELYDNAHPAEPNPSIELNVATADITTFEVENYGDYEGVGVNNLCATIAAGANEIVLDFYVDATAADIVGKYTINNTYEANTLASGELFWGAFPTGSYVWIGEKNAIWLTKGSMEIAKEGENYKLVLEATSAYESTLNLTYEGPITVPEAMVLEAPAKKSLKKKVAVKHPQVSKKSVRSVL